MPSAAPGSPPAPRSVGQRRARPRPRARPPRAPRAARGRPRALWFVGKRRAELRRGEAPAPGPGEVRVRAVLSAVSHGAEMLVYRGGVPEDLPLDLPTFDGRFGFPITHG